MECERSGERKRLLEDAATPDVVFRDAYSCTAERRISPICAVQFFMPE
jgi:hypothetical protein